MAQVNRRKPCERLAAVMKTLAGLHRDELKKLKANARLHLGEPDFVWRALVKSSSTWRSSRGYKLLFDHPYNYKKITFERLKGLSPKDRLRKLFETLTASNVLMSEKKAKFLAENFNKIVDMGGLAAANAKLLGQTTREAKMAFLKQFKGIGPKYSRDIFMDVYHPQFRQSIAVDARIQSISRELGLSLRPYPEGQEFYLSVAKKAGLSGWELDRLLYNHKREALDGLGSGAVSISSERTPAFCGRARGRKSRCTSNTCS